MFKGHAQNHSSLVKCIGQDSVNQCSVKKLLNINFNVSKLKFPIRHLHKITFTKSPKHDNLCRLWLWKLNKA